MHRLLLQPKRLLAGLGLTVLAVATPVAAAPSQGLPPMDSVPRPVYAGFANTEEDKPRLAVLMRGTPREFLTQLTKALIATRRFEVIGTAPPGLVSAWNKLVPGISLPTCRQLRKSTRVDRVLVCDLKETAGEVKVTTRLVWLDNGEVTRDLALFGKSTAAKTLALQLATFVRRATPIRCQIKSLADDHLVLDLGETSGMVKGTVFDVVRYANNLKPVEVGTVRVTALEPFISRAEVEEAAKDLTPQPGDVAIEQTSEMALN